MFRKHTDAPVLFKVLANTFTFDNVPSGSDSPSHLCVYRYFGALNDNYGWFPSKLC